jgi:putative membrane protein
LAPDALHRYVPGRKVSEVFRHFIQVRRFGEVSLVLSTQDGGHREMTDNRKPDSAPAKLAESASELTESAVQQTDSADRRTELAADRTIFAAERTYAAWVRTGLAALAAGVGAKALLEDVVDPWLASATASVLILFSALSFVAGVWRELDPGAPPPRPDIRRLPPWLLIGVNGFLMLVSLAAFVGIWVVRA